MRSAGMVCTTSVDAATTESPSPTRSRAYLPARQFVRTELPWSLGGGSGCPSAAAIRPWVPGERSLHRRAVGSSDGSAAPAALERGRRRIGVSGAGSDAGSRIRRPLAAMSVLGEARGLK
jgi:hypothetical protein